jgi:hypothetical protein
MKNVVYWIFLIPFLLVSQNEPTITQDNRDYLVVGTTIFSAKQNLFAEFRAAMKAHNEKFHDQGDRGVRIYDILNGPNTGKMVAVMGPFPWSALDKPIANQQEHDDDWLKNVVPNMETELNTSYWRFHHELSNFPPNFDVNKMQIVTFDIARMESERMKQSLEKVTKVLKDKYPELPFGVYTNEFPASEEGRDMSLAYFFDSFDWLSEDSKFKDNYEQVYGPGSFKQFLDQWKEIAEGSSTEIWVYNQSVSGIGSQVTTGSRIE